MRKQAGEKGREPPSEEEKAKGERRRSEEEVEYVQGAVREQVKRLSKSKKNTGAEDPEDKKKQ